MGEKANEMLEEVSEQEQEIKARLNGQYVSSDDQHRLDMIQKARQDNSLCVDSIALFSSQITVTSFTVRRTLKKIISESNK